MPTSLMSRLLGFARELQRATDFRQLLEVTQWEVHDALGYDHAWIFLGDTENPAQVRMLDAASSKRAAIWELAPVLTVKGDAMMEEIIHGDQPVVIEDARIDPRTNKELVGQLGNRTIINIPLRLIGSPSGAFGLGTFGDEGVRPPTPAQLDYLVGMASQLAVAASRLQLLEERRRTDREHQEAERKLFAAHKLQSLGLLAAGVAHDFSNLLQLILNEATLAKHNTDAPRALEHLDAAIDASERAATLTHELLTLTRQGPPQLATVDLNQRLQTLTPLLRRLLPENVEIDLNLGPRLPPVEADASQLDQVFLNLWVNARDAMPRGGKLSIATEAVDLSGAYVQTHPWARTGRYLLTTVSDTGAGMSDEVLKRAFEPLFTTRRDAGGTGLGLALVDEIVKGHRGLVHCTSQPGSGSRFEIFLPAR